MNVVLRLVQAISFMTLLGVTSDRSLGDVTLPCTDDEPGPIVDCGPAPICPPVGSSCQGKGWLEREKGSWFTTFKQDGNTKSESSLCYVSVDCMYDAIRDRCVPNPGATRQYYTAVKFLVNNAKCLPKSKD